MTRPMPHQFVRRATLLAGLAGAAVLGTGSASAGTLNLQVGLDPAGCIATPYFASGMTGSANCSNQLNIAKYGTGWSLSPLASTIGAGTTAKWTINAPAGITIDSAQVASITSSGLVAASSHGWQAGDYWAGGSSVWSPTAKSVSEGDLRPLDTGYYGFKLFCFSNSCKNNADLDVGEVDLQATENQGPSITALGYGNLWYEGSNWVWNPTGDPWPVPITATDPSGTCRLWVSTNANAVSSPASSPNTDAFQQCPSPSAFAQSQGAEVDTNEAVPSGTSGSFTLTLGAQNAAGVQSTPSETIKVDNVAPSVTLASPNDSNPGGWAVNHAVTVTAATRTGPSGLSSLTCSVDGGAARSYPSGGLSVDGNGKHTVRCTASGGALDPQGAHNTGNASMSIDIDEQSPTLTFEAENPNNPDQVIVDTSDDESKVAGGQIEIAPAGTTNWTALPTAFTSTGQLIAAIPDAGLSGPYTVQATACSQVANCGSTTRTLVMPLRVAAISDVSFNTIVDGLVAKKVKERVLVGWHWAAVLRHGKAVKVKRGGHHKTITVVRYVERCTRTRTRTGKHKWTIRTTCRAPHVSLRRRQRVAFGQAVTVNGVLLSSQGVPLSNVPVTIMTAPKNGLDQFTQIASVTTNDGGGWSATLPAGPSRIIRAVYAGSATLLPASGQATVSVPARLNIRISPQAVPWGSEIRITGQVLGGYVPTNSNLLRLNVGIGRIGQLVGLPTIKPNGHFVIRWKFNSGHGVVHPWFSVATLSESAFPYTPATSDRVSITLGKRSARRHRRATRHVPPHTTARRR